jgi:hypothetical protein
MRGAERRRVAQTCRSLACLRSDPKGRIHRDKNRRDVYATRGCLLNGQLQGKILSAYKINEEPQSLKKRDSALPRYPALRQPAVWSTSTSFRTQAYPCQLDGLRSTKIR